MPQAEEEDFWAPGADADGTWAAPQLKAVSQGVALAGVGAAIAQLAMGDNDATTELVRHVGGAPCMAHACAVASSAVRSLLLQRTEEARTLLALDEVLLLPVEGDTTLLRALEKLALSVGSSGAPLLLRTLVAALSKVEVRLDRGHGMLISCTGPARGSALSSLQGYRGPGERPGSL